MARTVVPRQDNTARVPKTLQEPKKAAHGATNPKSSKVKRTTRTKQAGLIFPVGRIDSKLRKSPAAVNKRISGAASVYLAAALEYLCSEMVELSGLAAQQHKKKMITPRFVQLAVRGDEELNKMFSKVIIAQGGVMPKPIHESLLPKK